MKTKTAPLFDRDALLAKHGITPKEFERTGLQWSLLEDIYSHHQGASADLQTAATYISQRLQQVPSVHSLKVRVKHPEHLVAKIIRKKLEHSEMTFTLQSYQDQVTDLIGLRALHLFKNEWRSIHEFVLATWDLHEDPIAYVRSGDPEALLNDLKAARCKVTVHPFGYRSIHYILKFQPDKRIYRAELQVRTIFEEGWSEIDHRVRYPRRADDVYLADFLGIFNRLSGSADEMGTFIELLRRFAGEQAEKIAERDRQIVQKEADLEKAISELKISQGEKDSLKKQIEALRKPFQLSGNLSGATIVINDPILAVSRRQEPISIIHESLYTMPEKIFLANREQTCKTCGKTYIVPHDIIVSSRCPDCRKEDPVS